VNGLLEDPLVPAGALGLIALLAGFGFYRARQRKNAALKDSTFGESRLQPESFFGNSGGQNVDTNDHASTGSSMIYSPSQLDAVDDVDPVAEADVYLAYGRDLQAEEILKDALRTRPERLAIHQKLLEIYAKRRDAKAFEAIATLAFNLTDGMGLEWEQICEKGLALDPDNALYLPGGQPLAETAVSTRPASIDSVLPDLETDQDKPSAEPTRPVEGTSDLDLDLDFSLDEPDLPDLPEIDAPVPNLPAAQAATEPVPLAMSDEATWSVPEAIEPVEPLELDALDSALGKLDFTMPTTDADKDADAFDKTQVLSVPSMKDKPTDAFDKTQVLQVPSIQNKPAADSGMMEFDLGSLSLDFAMTKPGEIAEADGASGKLKPDLDEEPVTQAGAFPDMADDPLETKLALAEEFKAIGDDDGARALIEEVISEATGEMKAKAQRALNSL
jgi:pilus assembly protein FimV